MSTETAIPETTTTAPATKAAPKPKTTKAKASKAKANPSTNGSGPTIREQVFKLLNKFRGGLTGAEIVEKLHLKGIPALLKDEGVCKQPRIEREEPRSGERGTLYVLTSLGSKDLAAGKVDENAADPSGGKKWPSGR